MHQLPYRICTRCIMDTSDPWIRFDADGVCNHCRDYARRAAAELPPPAARSARWNEIVATIRREGQGREYDCVIGVSGGVDSTLVAYLAREAGLRPIAVHFDNGWNTELAVSNIQRALGRLGIDLITHVVDWEEFRDLQIAFLKASVPNAEIPTDHGLCATLWQTADRLKVKYLLSGSNLSTESIMPEAWAYTAYDLRHLKAIHRRFGSGRLKSFPRMNALQFGSYVFLKGIKQVNPINYTGYTKAEAVAILAEKLGWRPYAGKHYESVFTRFFQGAYLPEKFGFDKRLAHLSSLIVSGQMTREAALAALAEDHYPAELRLADRKFVMKKLGLSEADYQAILAAPPRTHAEYPRSVFLSPSLSPWVQVFKKRAMDIRSRSAASR